MTAPRKKLVERLEGYMVGTEGDLTYIGTFKLILEDAVKELKEMRALMPDKESGKLFELKRVVVTIEEQQ